MRAQLEERFLKAYNNIWSMNNQEYSFITKLFKPKPEIPRVYTHPKTNWKMREYQYKSITVHSRDDMKCAVCGEHQHAFAVKIKNHKNAPHIGICVECAIISKRLNFNQYGICYDGEINIFV